MNCQSCIFRENRMGDIFCKIKKEKIEGYPFIHCKASIEEIDDVIRMLRAEKVSKQICNTYKKTKQ